MINFCINLFIWVILIFGLGYLLSLGWVHNVAGKLFALLKKIPGISFIVNVLLNKNYINRIKDGDLPEVLFEVAPGTKKLGVAMNEFMIEGVTFCIIYEMTIPIPLTGVHFVQEKSKLIYTGRKVKDTAISSSSYWMNFSLEEKNLK